MRRIQNKDKERLMIRKYWGNNEWESWKMVWVINEPIRKIELELEGHKKEDSKDQKWPKGKSDNKFEGYWDGRISKWIQRKNPSARP